jgi:hypothetical protein
VSEGHVCGLVSVAEELTVKVDQELLRRGTDRDGTGPFLAIVFIGQWLVLALLQTGGYGC